MTARDLAVLHNAFEIRILISLHPSVVEYAWWDLLTRAWVEIICHVECIDIHHNNLTCTNVAYMTHLSKGWRLIGPILLLNLDIVERLGVGLRCKIFCIGSYFSASASSLRALLSWRAYITNIRFLSVMKVLESINLHIELTQVSNATVVAYFPPKALLFWISGDRPPGIFFFVLLVVGVCLSAYCSWVWVLSDDTEDVPTLPLNPLLPLTLLKLWWWGPPDEVWVAFGLNLRPNAVWTFDLGPLLGEARLYVVGGLRRLFDLELLIRLELGVEPAAEPLLRLFIKFYLWTIFYN